MAKENEELEIRKEVTTQDKLILFANDEFS